MQWRLTGRFLTSIVIVVVLVIILNIVAVFSVFLMQNQTHGQPIKEKHKWSAEMFTRNFYRYIKGEEGHVYITQKGKKELAKEHAWIQILDENGQQVYGYHLPKKVKKKYRPIEIINRYKYKEKGINAILFVSDKKFGDTDYSYFIGFKNPKLARWTATFNTERFFQKFRVMTIVLVIIDSIVALVIGYAFAKRLTRPINHIIEGIKRLADKDYKVHYPPKGLYKDVYYNVNHLSNELTALERERKQLDRMKEEWIANISHDIKTPLASVQGYAEMMKDPNYEFTVEEMREYAQIIESKAIYMKDVFEDLHLTTRLRNQGLPLERNPINLVKFLRNIVIDLLNDPRYEERDITFYTEEDIIPFKADETLLRRAMNNLIYNAVVHNDANVSIVVKVMSPGKITIEDNGRGIPKEELDRIFDRYYRGTNTGETHKGSGLGMAIAHDTIKAHGGNITIESIVGRGTIIDIEFTNETPLHGKE
ncbi:sensor histidine kinase [Fictibacillus macauensis]|nr:HAMP domain-containing sensor histidine kinase [Fictibacillus macauensis]